MRCYCKYGLSYHDLKEMPTKRFNKRLNMDSRVMAGYSHITSQ
jgi:transposase-like protein